VNRKKFAIVTDSTADIPAAIAQDHDVVVVPLSLSFGADTYEDGDLTQAEFFARMNAAPKLPTTSQPPVGAFIAAYERALDSAEQVLSVHISSKLSGTFESASQAAQNFAGKVHVFDSLNLSWGLGLQVIEAANSAAEGLSLDATVTHLENVRTRIRLIVGLDSLDNLSRGGRIGKVSAMLGALLNLKVTLTVDENGEFIPVARTRGERAALEHTMEWIAQQMGTVKKGTFAVGHALSAARAEKLAQSIRDLYEVQSLVVYEAGTVISTHTGTGWAVAVLPAE
jgi:DegV family protein with EDD domain